MVGTRFIVLRLKHMIRAGIFVLAGIIIIIALVLLILPKNKKEATAYTPGTYTAQIILRNKPVSIYVTVGSKDIQAIYMSEMDDTQTLFYPLFKPTLESLAKEIISKQTTNVATTPENMYTGKILLDAVNSALSKAEANPGA